MASTHRISLQAGPVLTQTFAALRHPNYRLWFSGQLISLIGTWMQVTAQGYLVYDLTHNSAYLGYVSFASGLPSILFSLYGGVIADRIPRRILLIVTQTAMMLLAFILAALVFTGAIQPWMIIVLAVLLGVANAFDTPARQAFVVELVERADLTNAIALNAMMFNSGAVVGPAFAGLVYALVGPGWCFTINGISFVVVIFFLTLMKLAPFVKPANSASIYSQLKEGLDYVRSSSAILALIAAATVVSTFGQGLVALLPAWAVNILGGNETTNGILYSARGFGALAGALIIATISRRKVRGRLLSGGIFALPVVFIAFALIRNQPASIFLLVFIGMAFMLAINSANALVQTRVPDHLRGRVMSIYTLSFNGGQPLGALAAGFLASATGEPTTVLVFSAISLLLAALILMRKPDLPTMG